MFLLLGNLAPGQSQVVHPTPHPAKGDVSRDADDQNEREAGVSDAAVAPDAPVITIDGLCGKHRAATGLKGARAAVQGACQTVVTRAQF